jgi:membrane complex biogenesis BtpA family protein
MYSIQEVVSIAMIQTPPLPGSFQHSEQSLDEIIDYVLEETRKINDCGFDAAILQNMGDMPVKQQTRPEVIAYFSLIAKEVKRNFNNLPLGILINWDGIASLAVAHAAKADFVRVEHVYTGVEVISTGLITAQCCEIVEMKKRLHTNIPVFADVYEPHGIPLGAKSIEDAAWETINEAFADGLFLSGRNVKESIEMVERIRTKISDVTIFLGGGASEENVVELLKYYDGVCVASWIKNGDLNNPIDPERAKRFIEKVNIAKMEKNKS